MFNLLSSSSRRTATATSASLSKGSSFFFSFFFLPMSASLSFSRTLTILSVTRQSSSSVAGGFQVTCPVSLPFSPLLPPSKSGPFWEPNLRRPPLRLRRGPGIVAAGTSELVTEATSPASFRSKNPKDVNVLVVGSTGYIGKFVVRELVSRGFNVIAVSREKSGIRGRNSKETTLNDLRGASVCFSDVTNLDALEESVGKLGGGIDVVVSCLASRSGGVRDSWRIDYEATRNSLLAGRKFGACHYVLLSAICVQKPLLAFQRAKLKFEAELVEEAKRDRRFTYSIVRPTAFFKSLAGQVELVKDGKPYVMFGDGKLCACKPISEPDLASFISDCVLSEDKFNRVLPIGGPGKSLTPLEQGEILFRLLGKKPKFLKVPIEIMDFAIGFLNFLVKVFPWLEDAAEYGKIGRYYAAESMLIFDPETGEYSSEKTPSYGKDTLEEFFQRVIREGMDGQELGEQTIF